MVLDIHIDLLENYNIVSSSFCQAWWCHLCLLPCEDHWGGGEQTVWFQKALWGPTPAVARLYLLTATPPSFTAYLEKLYKETSLNPFESCVPNSRRGMVLDGDVFLLGSLVRAMESLQMLSSWIDCIGPEAGRWGRHEERVQCAECCVWCFLTSCLHNSGGKIWMMVFPWRN